MPSISMELRNYNRVRNSLRKLASELSGASDETVRAFAQAQRARLKSTKYPPRRPNQKYVRTGLLANSWKVTKSGPGRYTITNKATGKSGLYAGYVVGGKGQQAWMHVGRWWVAKDVLEEATPELVAELTKIYQAIWQEAQ